MNMQSLAEVERAGDRAIRNDLAEYEDREVAKDRKAAAIDAMANDLYVAKLAALPLSYVAGEHKQYRFCYTGDALRELRDEFTHPLAIAIRSNDVQAAGVAIIKLVTDRLRKEAMDEAEDASE